MSYSYSWQDFLCRTLIFTVIFAVLLYVGGLNHEERLLCRRLLDRVPLAGYISRKVKGGITKMKKYMQEKEYLGVLSLNNALSAGGGILEDT